jgi:hypothetical protein
MASGFFTDQFDAVAAARRTITVYADEPRPELVEHFDGWNVEVRFDRLPEGTPEAFLTVRRGEEFLGSLDATVLDRLLEPPASLGTPGALETRSLEPLLSMLDGTTFRSFDRRQLLAVSREIEDRAWRLGTGRLHAGFQNPAALAAQATTYERLATSDLDTHVYIDGEWTADPIEGVTTHAEDDDELGRVWFVVLAGDTEQDCALVAVQRDERYDGFWTYDRDRVAAIDEHLRARYW